MSPEIGLGIIMFWVCVALVLMKHWDEDWADPDGYLAKDDE